MNTTSRTLLETVISTDSTLSLEERSALQRTLRGEVGPTADDRDDPAAPLFLTQRQTAVQLNVSRVTVGA